MKKSRIFMSLGALALVVASVIATKANKKFSTFTAAYYYVTGTGYITLGSSSCLAASTFLTTSNPSNLNTAYFDGSFIMYNDKVGTKLYIQ